MLADSLCKNMLRGTTSDIEIATDRNGYPALASWTAANPDYESFIFRRFDRLSAGNILYLESELMSLERRLDVCDARARQSNDVETSRSLQSWEAFEENAKDPSRLEHDRMKLVKDINKKLKKYREC